ncbi:hypothetical protein SRABI76_00138 [Microbacterium oxydans]|uniref:hypothetical protein n=1 Tax=Microbacterium oxydans TaxID=82380 RepID=UPI001DACEA2D|nr:hypothetical protein [Microbacterium oxydans]CAH0125568.1 hypothetical protein SRABI76_00138 [Microbacterium oxydans]
MRSRTTSAAAGALFLLAALTACSAPAAPEEPASPSTSPRSEPSAAPASTPTPAATGAPISCESMISAGTVQALTDAGWTAEPTAFVIGDVELTEGLLCFWGDYSVGSDHGQLYGWSEISPEDATKAQSSLLASGWTREDGPEGTYFTEDPRFSMGTDDDGYGMTYLFDDGWVKLADTKQSLLLIGWNG